MDLKLTTLDLEAEGGWLTVWFNEPERRNPLSAERLADLLRLCAHLRQSPLRGVVLRGRGGIFCAGGDLALFRAVAAGDLAQEEIEAISRDGARLFDALAGLPQVTVALAEGAAMAGGLGMLGLCDIAIATQGCRFGLSEARLGLVAAQIAPILVARIGAPQTRRLMVTGAPFSAEEALALGLIDRLIAPENIDAALADIRSDVRASAPGAVAASKALLAALPGQTRPAQIDTAARIFAEALLSEEGREGLAAFAQKRPPSWTEDPS